MRIYFWTALPIEEKARWTELRQGLQRRGIMVISNHDRHIHRSLGLDRTSFSDRRYFLSLFDGVVVDLSTAHEDIGFLITHATMLHLPILVLHGRNPRSTKLLDHLREDARRECVVEYDFKTDDVRDGIQDFLNKAKQLDSGQSSPTIKFTLRITPELSEYLDWKGSEKKQKKAEFLRSYLNGMMKEDIEYRQFRHPRRRNS